MLCGWYQIVLPNPIQPDPVALKLANDRHPHNYLKQSELKSQECKDIALDNKDCFQLKHILLFICGQALTI